MADESTATNVGQTQAVPSAQVPQNLQDAKARTGPTVGDFLKLMVNPPPPPPGEILKQPAQPLDEAETMACTTRARDILRRMRDFRRLLDIKRLVLYRQYIGNRDQQYFPDNVTKRSNTFVPYPQSNVEVITSRTLDAFFSFDPWFEVQPRTGQDDRAADAMQIVMPYKLHQAKLTDAIERLVRNIGIYGHGAIKVDWDWTSDEVTYAEPTYAMMLNPITGQPTPIPNPMTGEPIVTGYQIKTKSVPRNCPKFEVIDIFDLLVDPDQRYVGHITEKTWAELQRDAQANPSLYIPESIQKLTTKMEGQKRPEDIIIRIAELWDKKENTCTIITFPDDAETITYKDLRYAYRSGNTYSSMKRRIYTGEAVLLWYGTNQFLHKKPPILHTGYIKLPSEPYGLGPIEAISDLTEALNRFVNMVADNWNLGINQRFAYDTTVDIDHKAFNEANVPGGKIGVTGPPAQAIFPFPTFTPNARDYQILELYRGMIEMTSGISDFYSKGIGGPTNNRTATGIQSVIQESNFRFRMFIRNLELDIMQPLLEIVAALIQQYVTDQEEIMLTDAPPGIPKHYQIQPEELLGGMDFNLVAANYASNKVVRQRQLLAFANLAQTSPYLDQYQFLLEYGKFMEIRNMGKLLKAPQQVQQEQMQQQQQALMMHEMEQREEVAKMILQAKLNCACPGKGKFQPAKHSKPDSPGPGQGAGGGAKRTAQLEGNIPGANFDSIVREFAQNMGANAMGTPGGGSSEHGPDGT